MTAVQLFCREKDCYRCLYVHLPVFDRSAPGWQPPSEWRWRDDKVVLQPLLYVVKWMECHCIYISLTYVRGIYLVPESLGYPTMCVSLSLSLCPTYLFILSSKPPHGNVLPDHPHAGVWHQTRLCVWRQAPTAQVRRGEFSGVLTDSACLQQWHSVEETHLVWRGWLYVLMLD